MRIVARAPVRVRPRAAFASAVLLLLAVVAVLPAGTVAEEASQPSEPAAAQLDAGRNHTCAILAGAGVRCWGFAGDGELGYGTAHTIGDDETPGAAGPVDLGAGRTAASISAGHFHTCARLDDGSVRCWGFGRNGRLGHEASTNVGDNETPGSVPPVDLGAGRTAVEISAGGFHSCALLNGGDVRCWGYGFYGALGYGGDPNHTDQLQHPQDVGDNESPGDVGPVNLGAGRRAVAISAGGYHTCAILDDGTVRCWGHSDLGQLGYGSRLHRADPSALPAVDLGGQSAVAISAGELHTCALLADGSVRCWGSGLDGRLGNGNERTIGDDELPSSVPPVNLGRTATAISAGDTHSCARLDDGSVRCWGLGASGQLGYASTQSVGDNEPPGALGPVELGQGTRAISAGGRHSCARLLEGTVSCWGYGGNGRLGYCNERNVGDDEPPAALGAVPVELAVEAPSTAYPGCARPARRAPSPPPPAAAGSDALTPLAREAERRAALRGCLAGAARHARREIRRARRSGSRRTRARLRRHIKRHRAQKRRACLGRHGRTPGRVTGLTARALSSRSVLLSFKAPGSDGNRPPAARSYLVKQSRRPIRSRRAFRRAQALCNGRCRFPAVTQVGAEITLTVRDLRRRTRYYYAVAARDNVSGRLGPRSRAVSVRTRR